MRLSFADAQRNVAEIANRESYNLDVIYELLAAYGRSASAITKLRSGALNLASDKENDVLQRGVVYFKHVAEGNLLSVVDELDQDPLVVRYNPRYLIATDYGQLVAKDTKKDTTLDIKLRDIDRNVDFFYGWTGDEITSEKTEAVADRRAADKMKDLYAEIDKVNREKLTDPNNTFRHDLNVFFSRLLFCFFAEDTKIFSKDEKTLFTNSIKDYTQTDGSDLDVFLNTLFGALDTEDKSNFTSPYSKFPYVNGTIFDTKKHSIAIPKFNAQARKLMLDCGNLDWSTINPDIFGSMFQSIVDEEHRASNGMHYTSVPNIMRTIEPLFLDGLREEFDQHYDNDKKLNQLWDRISKIKVFDPACGSGNFLIIAYKELRKIEHGIIDRLFSDDYRKAQLAGRLESKIKLDNFYGIEIDDFAHEIAILSLYLAKHQMNIEFEQHFGKEIILIPLKDNAKIVQGNSMRIDWSEVCPNIEHVMDNAQPDQQYLLDIEVESEQAFLISKEDLKQKFWDEIYLIGNPPYLGSSMQDAEQKHDMAHIFNSFKNYKNLDLIAAWFKLGSDYIEGSKAQLAFVSTNSICQGEQVALLWPYVFNQDVEIGFAYTSFKWSNGAAKNAAVICVILGLRSNSKSRKYIIENGIKKEVKNINPYLVDAASIVLERRAKPLSDIPRIVRGNMPTDGGWLCLERDDAQRISSQYPNASKYIRSYWGSGNFISGDARYCIWVKPDEYEEAKLIPPLASRFELVSEFRSKSKAPSTRPWADRPYSFIQMSKEYRPALLIPLVSSEKREYIPMGYVDSEAIVSNLAFTIYDAPLWLFGILTSRLVKQWVEATGGKMKTDLRFSSALSYNNLPVPVLLDHQKQEVEDGARAVLFARENHSEKTFADMYNPSKMPDDLREAHVELDIAVDRLYRSRPYISDEERLTDLFTLYEQIAEKEKAK